MKLNKRRSCGWTVLGSKYMFISHLLKVKEKHYKNNWLTNTVWLELRGYELKCDVHYTPHASTNGGRVATLIFFLNEKKTKILE